MQEHGLSINTAHGCATNKDFIMTEVLKNGKYPFKKGSQNDQIVQYLLQGKSLYNWEMREKFNCLAHTARINEIRNHGFDVQCEQVGDSSVWRYWLPQAEIVQSQPTREAKLYEKRVLLLAHLQNEDVVSARVVFDDLIGLMSGVA